MLRIVAECDTVPGEAARDVKELAVHAGRHIRRVGVIDMSRLRRGLMLSPALRSVPLAFRRSPYAAVQGYERKIVECPSRFRAKSLRFQLISLSAPGFPHGHREHPVNSLSNRLATSHDSQSGGVPQKSNQRPSENRL